MFTPVSDPAHFIHDPDTNRYLPANKVATTLARQLSRMRLTEHDLLVNKTRGYRVTEPNGEPITTGVTA